MKSVLLWVAVLYGISTGTNLGMAATVSVGVRQFCEIIKQGQKSVVPRATSVRCIDESGVLLPVPKDLENPTAIAVGARLGFNDAKRSGHVCVIDSGKIRCWGPNGKILFYDRGLENLERVYRDLEGKILYRDCPTSSQLEAVKKIEPERWKRYVSAGQSSIREIEDPSMADYAAARLNGIFSDFHKAQLISAGATDFCATDGAQGLRCDGHFKTIQATTISSDYLKYREKDFIALDVGTFVACGVTRLREILCWGTITPAGAIFGDNVVENLKAFMESDRPSLTEVSELTSVDISVGAFHGCIRSDGLAKCWGSLHYVNEKADSVFAGSKFSCFVSAGHFQCVREMNDDHPMLGLWKIPNSDVVSVIGNKEDHPPVRRICIIGKEETYCVGRDKSLTVPSIKPEFVRVDVGTTPNAKIISSSDEVRKTKTGKEFRRVSKEELKIQGLTDEAVNACVGETDKDGAWQEPDYPNEKGKIVEGRTWCGAIGKVEGKETMTQENAEKYCTDLGLELPTGYPDYMNGKNGFPNEDSDHMRLTRSMGAKNYTGEGYSPYAQGSSPQTTVLPNLLEVDGSANFFWSSSLIPDYPSNADYFGGHDGYITSVSRGYAVLNSVRCVFARR